MNPLTRLAGLGLDVVDVWSKRRLPVLVMLVVSAVAALWPEWLSDAVAARHEPLVDSVVDVLSERTAGL